MFAEYGLIDSACAAFECSIALHEAFPEAHLQVAQICFSEGHLDKSACFYEQVVRFDPENAATHNNLGYVYKRIGGLDSAGRSYKRAVAVDSSFAEAYKQPGPGL